MIDQLTDVFMTSQHMTAFQAERLKHCSQQTAASPIANLPLTPVAFADAEDIITRWPGYAPTPLHSLSGLARQVDLGTIWYKDEGPRFGLGSFKALGGAYAVCLLLQRLVCERLNIRECSVDDLRSGRYADTTRGVTVASATDGNHGRSVAWGAQQFGCTAQIYIHAEVSSGREQALSELGASVVRIEGNYDASVDQCAADAASKGWFVVSDTSYEGYRDIPTNVMEGYSVMVTEVARQAGTTRPSHIFIQGGVGGLAASVAAVAAHLWKDGIPNIVIVEPDLAACLYETAAAGTPTAVHITEETVMAGLSCGEVSMVGWEVLERLARDFITIPDDMVAPAMRLLADAPFGDTPIVAGESAVAGLAGLLAAASSPQLRSQLGLSSQSRVLLLGTEGATDADIYQQMTGRRPEEVVA